MKKFLVLLFLLLFGSTAYAEDEIYGTFFTNIQPFNQSWVKTSDGLWHYNTMPETGLSIYIPYDVDSILKISTGILFDSNPTYPQGSPANDLGFGPVGNGLNIELLVGAIKTGGQVRLKYSLKNWWINDTTRGYKYLVSPNSVYQDISCVVEFKIF